MANKNAMIWKTISTCSRVIPAWNRYYHAAAAMPVSAPKQCFRRLFLHQRDLVVAHHGAINAVRQLESRDNSDIWIMCRDVFFDKQVEHKFRYFNPVQ